MVDVSILHKFGVLRVAFQPEHEAMLNEAAEVMVQQYTNQSTKSYHVITEKILTNTVSKDNFWVVFKTHAMRHLGELGWLQEKIMSWAIYGDACKRAVQLLNTKMGAATVFAGIVAIGAQLFGGSDKNA